ncbi:MAG: radical SAM protein [Ignisphaera sp.]|uniref:Radical SAM protein n=1 Tax=Ignisphaera aggregans TaxID=334771 RepID=A0A7J3MZX4_9CREN
MYLRVIKPFNPWKSGLCTCPYKWVLHPYTGCSHNCLYCYATSYIPKHSNVRPKERFIDRLRKDVVKLPKNSLIEISSSSDPYPSIETRYRLTRSVLEILLSHGFKTLIVTKSSMVTRDLDILRRYRDSVVVSITITTLDSSISSKLEPGAPLPNERIKAIEILTKNGLNVVVRIDPIIPYINDDYNDLRNLIKMLNTVGVKQITTSTYKARNDSLTRILKAFPNIKDKLIEMYNKDSSEYIHGYRYLKSSIRFHYMAMIREIVTEEGLVFGTCREGFKNLNTPGFACDGSTLMYMNSS